MNARMKWLSDIYMDMTGAIPPDIFWQTPTGQGIADNNPSFLYDQPTCNLDEIIRDIPDADRREVFRLIRTHNGGGIAELSASGSGESEEETLFHAVLVRSALRVPPPERRRDTRYQRSSEHELEELYHRI